MPKITFIGAGSTVFAKNLLGDILSFPELAESHIALMDIDPERLRTSEIVAHKVAQAVGAHPTITVHTDRRAALDGANYAINMVQIGGYRPATVLDFEIPKKYGLRQTIADTLGIGGIMRALRTIPVMLEMCRDMEEVSADNIVFLNYVNPMCMNTWACYRRSRVPIVGLCHSVQGTAEQLARDIDVPVEEINYLCAGINHMAFYLRFERNGEDLYPRIRQVIAEGRIPDWNRVRYEMLQRLGYFVTESSEHFAEYCPYFIRRDRPDLIERYNVPLDEYIRRCEDQIAGWHRMKEQFESDAPVEVRRSHEYGSLIIHSMETGIPRVIYGNVENRGLITNLPEGCCVELPVLVDKNGLQPTRVGPLPPQLAAIIQTNVNVQALTVEAALTGKREHVYHAAMLDPHTAAELTLDEIWALVDELIAAHGDYIPPLH
ncbi:MAG: alpha-glucosidase/alpha-galactosidase [Chloroherpetonaceae bacterium]|nr:alpha-glucosidase/alpha-galactosidase [Chthonomonadaceae bacterium]MDW8209162.1 alpha-glucosidase/alpha-galactosidase [Chloroherpetonaceae bacterium]